MSRLKRQSQRKEVGVEKTDSPGSSMAIGVIRRDARLTPHA
jgi:hypothetical protein